jgi:hypothetical protein
MVNDNKEEKALNLLIEAYKLYAAFCAVIIAGLLSYSSSTSDLKDLFSFRISIGSLSLCSLFCIAGIQYFISEVYNGIYNIYAKKARIIFSIVMLSLFIGVFSGFWFLINQDKLKMNQDVIKVNVLKEKTAR